MVSVEGKYNHYEDGLAMGRAIAEEATIVVDDGVNGGVVIRVVFRDKGRESVTLYNYMKTVELLGPIAVDYFDQPGSKDSFERALYNGALALGRYADIRAVADYHRANGRTL